MTSDLTPPSPYADPAFLPEPAPPAEATPLARPRIRWAGIVWGTFFAAIAVVMLWTLTDPMRRGAIRDWILALSPTSVTPGTVVGVSLLVLGVLLLVGGRVAVLRRAQVRATGDADRMDECARF
ncbi:MULTISPECIES: hypothetical protein [unclassified Microbacterium]|uniref:hypothetical protein n=1 Tax=unclassified Microbacterium TaxID=2609290 RepID=UPI00214BF6BB|nr:MULTISPECIES: hypothetical protein [unclassified Microbacterium]MCR2809013.1 hypothetical protein [Microbacterium sp. zg.B185]WIM18576.1 hypothetical protein QNO12_13385 [Microbacterium sp. zg-B185]